MTLIATIPQHIDDTFRFFCFGHNYKYRQESYGNAISRQELIDELVELIGQPDRIFDYEGAPKYIQWKKNEKWYADLFNSWVDVIMNPNTNVEAILRLSVEIDSK